MSRRVHSHVIELLLLRVPEDVECGVNHLYPRLGLLLLCLVTESVRVPLAHHLLVRRFNNGAIGELRNLEDGVVVDVSLMLLQLPVLGAKWNDRQRLRRSEAVLMKK